MSLLTGTPLGQINAQENTTVEGAPWVYFQDASANELKNPDADGFYWGLSGTVSYPVQELACYSDVRFGDDVEVNAVRCDHIGDKSVIQKRGHLVLSLTLKTLFPLSILRHIIRGSAVTVSGGDIEKMGIGTINNNLYYHVYLPVVYDSDTGDYVCITGHRCQFVNAWEINMAYGTPWTLTGVEIWMFADDTKPDAQKFATVIRADPSAIS